jgi:hypothetical protein
LKVYNNTFAILSLLYECEVWAMKTKDSRDEIHEVRIEGYDILGHTRNGDILER